MKYKIQVEKMCNKMEKITIIVSNLKLVQIILMKTNRNKTK